MTGRELDALELDESRVAVPFELENDTPGQQREAWIDYLAMAANTGGGSHA